MRSRPDASSWPEPGSVKDPMSTPLSTLSPGTWLPPQPDQEVLGPLAAGPASLQGGLAPGHQGRCSQTGRGIVMLGILASSAAGNTMEDPLPRDLALLEPLGKQPWLCAGRRPVLWTHRSFDPGWNCQAKPHTEEADQPLEGGERLPDANRWSLPPALAQASPAGLT